MFWLGRRSCKLKSGVECAKWSWMEYLESCNRCNCCRISVPKIGLLVSAIMNHQENPRWKLRLTSICLQPYLRIKEELSAASFDVYGVRRWYICAWIYWVVTPSQRNISWRRGTAFEVAVIKAPSKSSFWWKNSVAGTFCGLSVYLWWWDPDVAQLFKRKTKRLLIALPPSAAIGTVA